DARAALPVEAGRTLRRRGDAVSAAPLRSDAQAAQVILDLPAIALTARHGRASGQHQYEIAAQRAVHLAQVVHVDQAGAAHLEHRLGAQRLLGLAQGAAGVIGIAPDPDEDVVSVRLDLFDLGHV